jgi:membrane protease YdiL (CAAX protease family)
MSQLAPTLVIVLLVMASVYPVGFCSNVTVVLKGPRGFKPGESLSGDLAGFVVGYAALLAVFALVRPERVLTFNLPAFLPLLLLAPFVGLACIVVEYLVGILLVSLRTGKLVTAVSVHGSYAAVPRITVADVLSVFALVVGEELVLRQVLFGLLSADLGLALWQVITLCTMAYALNHLSFGVASVVSKLPSGLAYVLLYYVSGMSLGVVVVAHAAQNFTLLAFSRRRPLASFA